jgi:hypothetical protein
MNSYIRYPWVVAPNRLCRELGFQFKFSSLDTLRVLLRAHGKLAEVGPLALPETAQARQRRAG